MIAGLLRGTGRRAATAAALAAALALAGCGVETGPANELPDRTEPEGFSERIDRDLRERAAARGAGPQETEIRLVGRIDSLELGTLRRGRLLTVAGETATAGWYGAALRPRRAGRPGPDGFLEYDFIAAPPELNGAEAARIGTPAQRRVTAVRPIEGRAAEIASGVRVFAAQGPAAARFDGGASAD